MKKIRIYLAVLLCLILTMFGCRTEDGVIDADSTVQESESAENEHSEESEADRTNNNADDTDADRADVEEDQPDREHDVPADTQELVEKPDEDGFYTSPEEVALYIHTYGKLPNNFITKKEAETLGWDSKKGNLAEVAPGMSIGGNRFGNYEQLLPDGNYKECDVNYEGGYRGDERIVFDTEGNIYYTDDHYASFTQLYSGEE